MLTIFPNTKQPSKDCQRVLKSWQSGEISPNLVTLYNKYKSIYLTFSGSEHLHHRQDHKVGPIPASVSTSRRRRRGRSARRRRRQRQLERVDAE